MAPAQAATAPPQEQPQTQVAAGVTTDARSNDIAMTIATMRQADRPWSEIVSTLADDGVTGMPTSDPMQSTVSLPSQARDNGAVAPLSFRESVDMKYYKYYDNQQGETAIVGEYKWNNNSYLDDFNTATCGFPCQVGGEDALGIAVDRPINVTSYGAVFCGQNGGFTCGDALSRPADLNSSGVVFKQQDIGKAGDYSMATGVVTLRTTSDTTGIQAFPRYAHTWSSTGITGVSVSPSDVSFDFSASSNSFEVFAGGPA